MTEGEDIVLDGAGAIEAPVVFGYGLGELGFDDAFGTVFAHERGAELVEGIAILPRHAGDLAGEAVARSVVASGGFAGAVAGPVECSALARLASIGRETSCWWCLRLKA